MTASRSPATHPKTPRPVRRTASASGNKAASGTQAARPANQSRISELLREMQIDGKALSVQIERLRHRFL